MKLTSGASSIPEIVYRTAVLKAIHVNLVPRALFLISGRQREKNPGNE